LESKNYNHIQCLRGVAAILVLLFHFAPQLERYGLSFLLPKIEKWGFWGVDIFFVLSGFVIALSAEKLFGLKDGCKFITKRSLRIFLGYWPDLILWMGITVHSTSGIDVGRLFSSWLLLSGNMSDHILPIAWSLYFELVFYVFSFMLIVFAQQNKRAMIIQIFSLIIFIWCSVWLLAWPSDVMAGAQPLRGVLSAFAIEFFAGVLIYKSRSILSGNLAVVIPLFIAALTLLIVGMQSPWFDKIELLRMGTYGLAAAATVAITVSLEGLRYSNFLSKIGDASYSLYLTHVVVIDMVVSLVSSSVGLTTDLGRILVLSVPALAILFAVVWYKFIERPLYTKVIELVRLK